jgi:acetylglutamate kinase
MEADELVFISNVPGILRDDEMLPHLSVTDLEQLIEEGVITDGMIPKSRSALQAVQAGVVAVRITNLEGLKAGTGTTITL